MGTYTLSTYLNPFTYRHHHVYCDNFFSSVDLSLNLERNGLYTCGTLRTNRKGYPEDMKEYTKKSKIGERGDSITRQSGNLTVTAWQDNKVVNVISTLSDPNKMSDVQRKLKDGHSITVPCPESVSSYNKFMGGVDRNDQLRKYYHFRLKSRKFYRYIFWFLVELSITNAFILCKNHTHLNITGMNNFKSKLADALIGSFSGRKRRGRPSLAPVPKKFSVVDHWPTRGAEKSHHCHYCQVHLKKRRETVWRCQTCEKFLCHTGREDDCFYAFHTKP